MCSPPSVSLFPLLSRRSVQEDGTELTYLALHKRLIAASSEVEMAQRQSAPTLDNGSAVLRAAKVRLREGRISLHHYLDLAAQEVRRHRREGGRESHLRSGVDRSISPSVGESSAD